MADRIGIDELLSELAHVQQERREGPPGFTVQDVSDYLLISTSGALSKVRTMVRAGHVEYLGLRESVGISGRRCHTPVYGIVRKGEAKMACKKGKKKPH